MKRDYKLKIADNTSKTFDNNIPDYTTDQAGFKKWFESDIYRDEIFIDNGKNNVKAKPIYKKMVVEKEIKNVDYRAARTQAINHLIKNKNLKNNDYLTNDIILEETRKGNNIIHKMNWKAVSNRNVVLEGWEYYRNNKLVVGDKKKNFNLAKILVIVYTIYFILSALLLVSTMNSTDNFGHDKVNQYKWILDLVNFLGALTYSSIASIVREEFNNNVKNSDEILYNSIKLEIPFWLATIITLPNFLFGEQLVALGTIGTVILLAGVLTLLAGKLWFEYDSDLEKYYSNKTEEAQRS